MNEFLTFIFFVAVILVCSVLFWFLLKRLIYSAFYAAKKGMEDAKNRNQKKNKL